RIGNRAEWHQQITPEPMTGGALAAQQPGGAERQRSGAYRGHEARGRGEPAEFAEKRLVVDRVVRDTATAGHADDVAGRDVGEPVHPGESKAAALDRAVIGARQDDGRAWQA